MRASLFAHTFFAIKLILIISVLVLSSCVRTPEQAERRIAKLYSRFPQLTKVYTTFQTDTVQLPPVVKDSLIHYPDYDTVVITQDRVKVRVKVDTVQKNVYVKVESKPREIIKKEYINKPYPVIQTDWWDEYIRKWWLWLLILIGLYALYKVVPMIWKRIFN